MDLVFNDSVGEVLFTSVCRTLFHNIAKIRKSFAALLLDLPRFRTAFTSRSSASRLVLLLSDLLLQVGNTQLLKMERNVNQTGKKLTNKIPTGSWVISHIEPT
jgi:hypothetical protein